ncbi:MAG: DUF1992 domain-containing protein [Desulfovibrionaceae bacterium]|nr:DUF1992 domain-containing protein [Desulfovibrionaceae bacterium]
MSENPFSIISMIAEQRIAEAQQQGAFDNLAGAGKPLQLEDDSAIPEDLRMAYKVLKNSGYVPEEIAQRKEISNLMDMLEKESDEQQKIGQMRRMQYLLLQMRLRCRRSFALEQEDPYYQQILERLAHVHTR